MSEKGQTLSAGFFYFAFVVPYDEIQRLSFLFLR